MFSPLPNAKEEKFCRLYAYGNTATDSYNMAWGRGKDASRGAASVKACELMKRPGIAERIIQIRNRTSSKAQYTQDRLFADALAIATVDKREFMEIRHGSCRFCYGDGHLFQWKEREFLEAVRKAEVNGDPLPDIGGGFGYKRLADPNPDCPECEGAGVVTERLADTRTYSPIAALAFDGFKPTANGLEVKTVDRAPYWTIVSKMLGVADKKILTGPDNGPIKLDVSGLSAAALEELAELAPDD